MKVGFGCLLIVDVVIEYIGKTGSDFNANSIDRLTFTARISEIFIVVKIEVLHWYVLIDSQLWWTHLLFFINRCIVFSRINPTKNIYKHILEHINLNWSHEYTSNCTFLTITITSNNYNSSILIQITNSWSFQVLSVAFTVE